MDCYLSTEPGEMYHPSAVNIMHRLASNDIHYMQFNDNPRLGRKSVVPPLFTHLINLRWILLYSGISCSKRLPEHQSNHLQNTKRGTGNSLNTFPGNPPTKGCTATNNNSLLVWTHCQKEGRTLYCCPEVIPAKPT